MGVCALVGAWNATLAFVGMKLGACLAAGNTAIFKASEKSPLAVLMLAPLFKGAGFPDGVVNFVSGAGATGDLLAKHMQIRKISFTGSLSVGRLVLKAAAESNLKRVTLELGGKSPAVVFADADLETAVAGVSQAILSLSGQICVCTSRVIVEESIVEDMVQGVKAYLEGARQMIGDPMKEGMFGPLVDEKQFDRVMGLIKKGKEEAELITGGERNGTEGFFVQPTLFLNPGSDATIFREEIFGPVIAMKTFKTEEEAIELANDTEFGLFATVFSKDIKKALRVAGKIEAGGVSINEGFSIDLDTSFGGWKQSGIGREGGVYGLKAFLQEKTIKINMR
jgi:aldehyde dehydrogenase (NAD+)